VTRSTQLRASFLQPGGHLRVVWWVSDIGHPLVDLTDDARADLADVLVDRHVQIDGPERWHVADSDSSTWLVLDLHTAEWLDPRRDVTRRATTPQELS
jgi:hypothetical protein